MISEDNTAFRFDFNQLVDTYNGTTTVNYTYDQNGNMTDVDDPTQTYKEYVHNRDNRLIAYEEQDVPVVNYAYDSSGRLLLRTGPDGTKTRYYYDGINQLMTREKLVSGVWRTKKVNALKEEDIGQILAHREYTAWSGSTPTAYDDLWYHYDMLGNVTVLTDGGGATAVQYDMEAFGTVKSGGQNGVHLTTKEWDAESELYYFNERWYRTEVARFTGLSPFSPDIEHPFAFANNCPSAFVDPTGRIGIPGTIPEKWDCCDKTGKNLCHCEFQNCMVGASEAVQTCLAVAKTKCLMWPPAFYVTCFKVSTGQCGLVALPLELACTSQLLGCLSGQ